MINNSALSTVPSVLTCFPGRWCDVSGWKSRRLNDANWLNSTFSCGLIMMLRGDINIIDDTPNFMTDHNICTCVVVTKRTGARRPWYGHIQTCLNANYNKLKYLSVKLIQSWLSTKKNELNNILYSQFNINKVWMTSEILGYLNHA